LPATRTFAYVSCADSREILVLELDPHSGDLAQVQALPAGGMVMPLAVSPDKRYLHASLRSQPYRVLTCAIERDNGQLAVVGEAPLADSMAYLHCDRSGAWLLSASFAGHKVAVSRIGHDGMPHAAHQVLEVATNSHAIVPAPSNRHAFVPCRGGGVVLQWCFDATTGTLTANRPDRVVQREGAGPRHFVFHPGGRHAYLLNELDATVSVFAYDDASGTLDEIQNIGSLPPGFTGTPWAADIHLTPDGTVLYTSERRSSTLAAFAVGTDGRLQPPRCFSTEREPRAFAIAPCGRYLLAVGQASHSMTSYAIDPASGALRQLRKYAMGRNPNWVEIITLAPPPPSA
jgi:6-phosphogluconolactonase